ncbi:uncharacterized protein FFB20_10401 [Fusarium fujikuroi]|uniref:Uncharacterized protein n=1 Tax=Fusarium fujikuroi TaxID=5127 RepID=A0A0I9YEL7_FUSFU|nr:uncharacterized protein LW93_5657 [Fusarium fujikuroi]KLO93648.1 uncharacterized protein Y057_12217 [Fusarium fujikuroi]KLP17975.1 uncharacterized protein LW94_4093 [Fusarium fujikuroi]QGI67735.1 hypothetical protein CEK27_011706 [Fusarium fujikuroi]QGI84968.1 hypothetical protein CEK25_011697 [Fusarium fujikuroi]
MRGHARARPSGRQTLGTRSKNHDPDVDYIIPFKGQWHLAHLAPGIGKTFESHNQVYSYALTSSDLLFTDSWIPLAGDISGAAKGRKLVRSYLILLIIHLHICEFLRQHYLLSTTSEYAASQT